jgi:hypothetical protein
MYRTEEVGEAGGSAATTTAAGEAGGDVEGAMVNIEWCSSLERMIYEGI